jgi:DNA-binding PadR family transcriptional regulator
MTSPIDDLLPLAPATLHILLSLAGERLHGYGIMQEVERQSEGKYRLGPGTLYDNLQRMVQQGLVAEVLSDGEAEKSRRRYYELSALGKGVLAAEIDRLEGVVKAGRRYLKAVQLRRA